jgi:hypothetical protein
MGFDRVERHAAVPIERSFPMLLSEYHLDPQELREKGPQNGCEAAASKFLKRGRQRQTDAANF